MRSAAGLLALLALTFSFAEAVWASTCLPGMRMDHASMMFDGAAPERVEETQAPAEHLEHRGGKDHRSCPFNSPLAAQACAGVSSMPARVVEPEAPTVEAADLEPGIDTLHDLLLESLLFRPPRA